jgi:prepilin-type N-terminal cleavage/methylation domain-containing protein
MKFHKDSNLTQIEKGFTLLEILLVIAAIGILAAIVIVAINPNRQLASARNAARRSDINTIVSAFKQYSIEQGGENPSNITEQYQEICREGETDPSCVNVDYLVPTYIASIPQDMQSAGVTTGYEIALSSENNDFTVRAVLAEQSETIVINAYNDQSGRSASLAAQSCQAILEDGLSTGDGVYWIDLPTSGPTETYCLMDTDYDGGGWMMALKATRGNTFQYDSPHWTTDTTLNPTELNTNDGDAKFAVMNEFEAQDMMAIWPDIQNGGSIPASTRGWTWLQNDFYGGTPIIPITFWSTVNRYFISHVNSFFWVFFKYLLLPSRCKILRI